MATHGDVREVTYDHPELGDGRFLAKSGEGNTFDQGGLRNSDDANSITSAGTLIVTKNYVRGFMEIVCENDMNDREDATRLAELAASSVPAEWTISLVNGTVWRGTGVPVGDIQSDVNAGTFTVKIAAGIFEKIEG